MFVSLRACLLGLFAAATLLAQTTTWQTTHTTNWHSNGQCGLESNALRMTVGPYSLDVEEEATIVTQGTVSSGDSKTLEIVGQFQLSPGSALRSMLLWNGTKILKAKLKDKTAADSAYEGVVDRDAPVFVSRDPALIEYLGDGTYRFQIYPVAIGASRKIRILYTVPLQALSSGPAFEVRTAFTVGCVSTPSQVGVELRKSASAFDRYVLQHGDTKRTVQFGATYQLPYADLYTARYYVSYPEYRWHDASAKPLRITPDTASWNCAYATELASGNGRGNYTAIFSHVPDSLRATLDEVFPSGNYTLETRVTAGEKTYIADMPYDGCFGVYLKSSAPWDGRVYWTAYDDEGFAAVEYTQTLAPAIDPVVTATLPLVWGAKYSLVENSGSLGALYGFIDSKMSLLALESDTLRAAVAAEYADNGVPPLLAGEIILAPSKMPTAPKENVIFEFKLPVLVAIKEALKRMLVTVLPGRVILAFGELASSTVRAALFDVSGRTVVSWSDLHVQTGTAQLVLPRALKGTFVLRVTVGSETVQRRVVVR